MGRNADGQGHGPNRWRDRWRAYITLGYDQHGRAIRKYVYGKTQDECLAKLDEARGVAARGEVASNMRLDAYVEDWLAQKAREVKPATIRVYRKDLAFALKHLGRLSLDKLEPLHIRRMMHARMSGEYIIGKTRKEYKERAANQARGVLANALGDAVRMGLLPTNPAARVRPFRQEREDLTIWTAQQVMGFLHTTAAGASAHHALFYVALTTGLRAGELMALEWRDVTGAKLSVRRTVTTKDGKVTVGPPKSRASRRVLHLPDDTVEVLARHRRALAGERTGGPLVFPTAGERMVSHTNLRKSLHRWAVKAGVPKLRPHDLRHTFASMAISQGTTPAELARQLGHTDAGFTLRQYVHFFEVYRPRTAPSLAVLTGLGETDKDEKSVHHVLN